MQKSDFDSFLRAPTLRVRFGENPALRPTLAGKESKKGCNLVTLGVKYASVYACYVNAHSKSGTKEVRYEATNPQPGADAVPACGAAALPDDGPAGSMPRRMRAWNMRKIQT